ncbi:aromatic-L-amino-acid/L-tryptophan decarboxylase [Schistosoma bovis]|uniref:Aromatic-L-amino-acid decarboxylase n=1 Tax=Schistosoma bovis TaxID=6184 RepID=A0A430QE35_SCHBO|nr:aromatic-L-amino-acid/L-tryptophan decarboxylase [Schistosoma bovis]
MIISGSCSESTLVALLAARNKAITQYQNIHPNVNNYDALSKLVGYYSDQAHSSVERAGLIGMLQLRAIKSNEHYEMDTTILEQTIKDDVNNGLIPFFCCATLGTTATCGFDKLKDIGPICDKYNIWLHVDAAYAGSSFICPEYRYLMDGIEYATSFVFNPHKWLLINFDCSIVWYREVNWVKNSFHVDPPYLKHKHQQTTIDFRHIQLAHYFEKLIQADDRFEIVADVLMGLVCFRIKLPNFTEYRELEISSELHSPAPLYFIRFAICYHSPNKQHIEYAYQVIHELCNQLLDQQSNPIPNQQINHENINLLLLDHENHN